MNEIERALFEKTKDFQQGQVYADQWRFVKSYLPQLLDTISHVFPHYSLHNATHSEAIINNIVRIVGVDSINKLSVVDLWLLLAAAYYHDCGMVVTAKDKEVLFKEGSEFIKYVEKLQHDNSSPLYEYAILFEVKEGKVYYINGELTNKSYEGARFLLADFVRKRHAERSEERIETDASLRYPGEPIPERIIRILKTICRCHTMDVKEVMKLQLVESSGCGVEDCHPRFVAAMLRLGDLLDIDSNRVSEVLLSTLGSIPSDSKYYNIANRAITHIRIDRSIIEITAECNDYHVADLINRWLEWLNDELVFYMQRWHKIIPFEDFGYLPTVGDLNVILLNYDTFDGKKRPGFEIDSSKAIELLQGSGLYTDSCECIRELLQNAVDATYLRIYKENPGITSLKQFKNKCANYPISVRLNQVEPNDKGVKWNIKIDDQGIGMTKEDLSYLSKTGSSGRNVEKQRLIQSVPEFMWPSGTFGIGFQSVFLITDRVNLVTRKLNKDSYLKVEMFNPSGKENGAILIQSISRDDVSYGTSISFEFQESSGEHQYISSEDRYSASKYYSFDFAKSEHINLMGMKVMDEVVRFANGTFVPVDFYLEGEKKKYVSQKSKIEFEEIDEETGMQVFVDKKIPTAGSLFESKVYYRNQCVRDFYPDLPFLSFHVNILSGSAKDILTLNRSNIRHEYETILRNNIRKTIIRYLNKKIESFDATRKQLASMFLELHKPFIERNQILGITYRDYWRKYELKLKKDSTETIENLSLEKLLESDAIERHYRDYECDILEFEIDGAKYRVNMENEMWYWFYEFVLQEAPNRGYTIEFIKGGIVLKKDECDAIEDSIETYEDIMYRYLRYGRGARGLFPCTKKYSVLQIHQGAFPKLKDELITYDYPCMISPFIRKYDVDHFDEAIRLEFDVDSKVINTVFEHRIDKSVKKEQIKAAYDAFKREWEPIVEKVNVRAKTEPHNYYLPHRYRILV